MCRGVDITDSILVDLGRHQVANSWVFVHRGQCEFQFFNFSLNCELRFCLNFQYR